MDLSTIDPAVIEARGRYATVNGEYKTLMSTMQSWAQQACDGVRHGLNEPNVEAAQKLFDDAATLCDKLKVYAAKAAELKEQKDELWPIAWGNL
ncbi:hypothetical protein F0160_22500 [Paraburkholderia sp. JPY303]|uniref:hypothetical protein n=1 Tax=Paraburkholderia atlantica TaxID=2654982 RepID=UPI001C37B448|nr:hypothetical protein [Paraburkholderia atlantica]NUY33259.1 hypothetical protein [Paraburkholderia atlantica]